MKPRFFRQPKSKYLDTSPKPVGKARVEFTGVLSTTPFSVGEASACHFQLETYDSDILLRTEGPLSSVAKKHLWEEVRVRGYFDDAGTLLHVESIIPTHVGEETPFFISDFEREVERIRETISRNLSIEPSPDFLVA